VCISSSDDRRPALEVSARGTGYERRSVASPGCRRFRSPDDTGAIVTPRRGSRRPCCHLPSPIISSVVVSPHFKPSSRGRRRSTRSRLNHIRSSMITTGCGNTLRATLPKLALFAFACDAGYLVRGKVLNRDRAPVNGGDVTICRAPSCADAAMRIASGSTRADGSYRLRLSGQRRAK